MLKATIEGPDGETLASVKLEAEGPRVGVPVRFRGRGSYSADGIDWDVSVRVERVIPTCDPPDHLGLAVAP